MRRLCVAFAVCVIAFAACGEGGAVFGDLGSVPEEGGFAVLCSGHDEKRELSYVMLEGPFADTDDYMPMLAPYSAYLAGAGFEMSEPVGAEHDFGWLRVEGARADAVVNATLTNTMHSSLIILAWAPASGALPDVARFASQDSECYGRIAGIINGDEVDPRT